ncbi:MAG TPA: PEP-CTERM sorting domain-containing protein [Chthoniobacteraceae bacterium]|jgi:hypothetical protein
MKLTLLTAAAAAISCTAGAAIVNVDFNSTNNGGGATYSGLAAAPDQAGTNALWNGISNNTFGSITGLGGTDLPDSTGAATDIDITIGRQDGGFTGTGNNLLKDYLFLVPGQSSTFTLSGLSPQASYNVYIYSMGDTAGQGGTFTYNGTSLSTSASPLNGTTFVAGNNYVVFTGVTSAEDGTAGFTWAGVSSNTHSALNGIQIEIVPEPTSVALLGLGAVGLGLIRRRRVS